MAHPDQILRDELKAYRAEGHALDTTVEEVLVDAIATEVPDPALLSARGVDGDAVLRTVARVAATTVDPNARELRQLSRQSGAVLDARAAAVRTSDQTRIAIVTVSVFAAIACGVLAWRFATGSTGWTGPVVAAVFGLLAVSCMLLARYFFVESIEEGNDRRHRQSKGDPFVAAAQDAMEAARQEAVDTVARSTVAPLVERVTTELTRAAHAASRTFDARDDAEPVPVTPPEPEPTPERTPEPPSEPTREPTPGAGPAIEVAPQPVAPLALTFDPFVTKRLAENHDTINQVYTTAGAELREHLLFLHGGSIGVAGPRGAGKSHLLRVACSGDLTRPPTAADPVLAALSSTPADTPGATDEAASTAVPTSKGLLGFVIPAPTTVDPLDLVITLQTRLLDEVRVNPRGSLRDDRTQARRALVAEGLPEWEVGEQQPEVVTTGRFLRDVARRDGRACQVAVCLIVLCAVAWFAAPSFASNQVQSGLIRTVAGLAASVLATVILRIWAKHALRKALDAVPVESRTRHVIRVSTRLELARQALLLVAVLAATYFASKLATSLFVVASADGDTFAYAQRDPLDPASQVAASWTVDGLRFHGLLLVVATASLALLLTWFRTRGDTARPTDATEPDADAKAWIALVRRGHDGLDRLRSQVTLTESATTTATLKATPIDLGRQRARGRSVATRPMALPAASEELRSFCTAITRQYGTLAIGIDELDKAADDDEAAAFLNGIKIHFGVEDVFFLISVSDSAVAAFERRGIPFRDVFDSCFDHVLRADELSLQASARLVSVRCQDQLPLPFIWLAYCLSGGLPRDLIRHSRAIVMQAAAIGGPLPLDLAAQTLVDREIEAKAKAVADLLTHDAACATLVMACLQLADDVRRDPELALRSVIETWAATTDPDPSFAGLAAYTALAMTVRDLLGTDALGLAERVDALAAEVDEPTTGARSSLDLLAEARAMTAVSATRALQLVDDVRERWDLAPLAECAPRRAADEPPVAAVP